MIDVLFVGSSLIIYLRKLKDVKKTSIKPVSAATNPLDQQKIIALRKKVKRNNRQAKIAKYKVELLTRELSAKQEQMSKMTNNAFDEKCSIKKIPDVQKILLQEIINASKVINPKGRRYSKSS